MACKISTAVMCGLLDNVIDRDCRMPGDVTMQGGPGR